MKKGELWLSTNKGVGDAAWIVDEISYTADEVRMYLLRSSSSYDGAYGYSYLRVPMYQLVDISKWTRIGKVNGRWVKK